MHISNNTETNILGKQCASSSAGSGGNDACISSGKRSQRRFSVASVDTIRSSGGESSASEFSPKSTMSGASTEAYSVQIKLEGGLSRSDRSVSSVGNSVKTPPISLPPAVIAHRRKMLEKEEDERRRAARAVEKQEQRQRYAIHRWSEEILPSWEQKRGLKSTAVLCMAGIPPAIRGKAWKVMAGNELGVSPTLYEALLVTAAQTRKELGLTDIASEGEPPAEFAQRPLSGRKVKTHESMKLITQDLPRTFHKFAFFRADGPLRTPLRQILEALVCFRPDMGYVQGMSFLGAMLLLYMETYDAFQCLVNLLEQYVYISYVSSDCAKLARLFSLFEELLKKEMPGLYKHFKKEGIRGEMYLLDWFLTLFLKPLPLHVSARVFDNYLLHGDIFIWRTSLGILKMLSPRLMKMEFEDIVKTLGALKTIDEHALFECIKSVQINKQRFINLMQRLTWDDYSSGLGKSRAHTPSPPPPPLVNTTMGSIMESISSIFKRSPKTSTNARVVGVGESAPDLLAAAEKKAAESAPSKAEIL